MKSAVIVFPASNCDRDARPRWSRSTGKRPQMVWHQDTDLPDVDCRAAGRLFLWRLFALRRHGGQSPIMRDGQGACRRAAARCSASATASRS